LSRIPGGPTKKNNKETLVNVSIKKNKKKIKSVYLRNSPRTGPKSNSMLKPTKETRKTLANVS